MEQAITQIHWVIGTTHPLTTRKLRLVNLLKQKIDDISALKLVSAAFDKSHAMRDRAIATIRHLLKGE